MRRFTDPGGPPAGRPRGEAPSTSPTATAALLAWLALGVAACATTAGPRPAPQPQPSAASGESWLLGPFTSDRCFHVTLAGPRLYHFVINRVEYPRALGSGQVTVVVHAIDIGPLQPRPDRLARLPRLEFDADGDASGAFEVTLLLVDGEGRESQSLRLDQICKR